MDRTFLDTYEEELRFLREMGKEFAQSYPKIASRLELGSDEVPDPYVERLLEGFAFLTARVRMKMDAQYPEFTQNLLGLLYPNVVAPTPSCTILELKPDFRNSALVEGFTVPRGTSFVSESLSSSPSCEFTSTCEMTLRPLVIDEVELHEQPSFLQKWLPETPDIASAIRLRIRVAANAPLGMVALDGLQVYLTGTGSQPDTLQQSIMSDGVATFAYPVEQDYYPEHPSPIKITHDGFAPKENLLPHTAKTFSGHRLIQEAFILPEKFRFISFHGVETALRGADTRSFDIVIGLRKTSSNLAAAVTLENFRLHCLPAINCFERRADRIPVKAGEAEHLVTVDRTRPQAFEVFDVLSVEGLIEKKTERLRFVPLFQPSMLEAPGDERQVHSYFNIRRSIRLVSASQLDGRYLGTDTHLTLAGPGGGPAPIDIGQLVITTLCTNRGLPALLGADAKYTAQTFLPIDSVKGLIRPTTPRLPLARAQFGWDLINALSLNHLSLSSDADTNAQWLSRLLTLFTDSQNDVHRQMIQGFYGLKTRVINRRLPGDGPITYGRGLEFTLLADMDAMRGTGPFLLSSVLERFFARAATLNSFTQTVLSTSETNLGARWPVRLGARHLV